MRADLENKALSKANQDRRLRMEELLDEVYPHVESIEWDPARDFVYDVAERMRKFADKTLISEKQVAWMEKIVAKMAEEGK